MRRTAVDRSEGRASISDHGCSALAAFQMRLLPGSLRQSQARIRGLPSDFSY